MAKFNLNGKIALFLFALFTVIMATYLQGLYVLVIILAGIATFNTIAKMVR